MFFVIPPVVCVTTPRVGRLRPVRRSHRGGGGDGRTAAAHRPTCASSQSARPGVLRQPETPSQGFFPLFFCVGTGTVLN